MSSILIVGCGNLGQRYIESIDNYSTLPNIKLFLVDPLKDFSTISIKNCQYNLYKCIDDISPEIKITLLIIATCADIRYKLLMQSVNKFPTINKILLEKVLFQEHQHYVDVERLISDKNIQIWVNTPRRTFDYYKQIKEYIGNRKNIKMLVEGSDWGLLCNAIHFIDLYCYLTSNYPTAFIIGPENQIIKSKRNTFLEMNGGLTTTDSGLSLNSCGKGRALTVTITCENQAIIVHYAGNDVTIDFGSQEIQCQLPYLSQYIYKHIDTIIKYNASNLPSFKESSEIHLPFIDSLTHYFQEHGIDGCPIT